MLEGVSFQKVVHEGRNRCWGVGCAILTFSFILFTRVTEVALEFFLVTRPGPIAPEALPDREARGAHAVPPGG